MECKEWAKKKEREAFEMEKQDILEWNMLRKEKLGSEGFKKKKKNEFITTRIAEMLKKELDRGKESDQLAHLNEKMKTLELGNSEIRADVSALKITEEEIKRNLKGAVKKEKEELKRIGNSEKQICKFQGHIHEEKEKIIQLDQQLHLVNEAQKEIKLKQKHEQEEREGKQHPSKRKEINKDCKRKCKQKVSIFEAIIGDGAKTCNGSQDEAYV